MTTPSPARPPAEPTPTTTSGPATLARPPLDAPKRAAGTPAPNPKRRVGGGLLDPRLLLASLPDALRKLNPGTLWRNPVMLVVEIGSVLTTWLAIRHGSGFAWWLTGWLWLTVLFANLAEAVAESRGQAQADTLRRARTETTARRLLDWRPGQQVREEQVPAVALQLGDHVLVEAGQLIPGDGDVVDGVASVDESAITGESAPVIRESGGDRSAVTGGTKVLSDRIVLQITSKPGETFLDRMIALVEGASRQKTPNADFHAASSTLVSGELVAESSVAPPGDGDGGEFGKVSTERVRWDLLGT